MRKNVNSLGKILGPCLLYLGGTAACSTRRRHFQGQGITVGLKIRARRPGMDTTLSQSSTRPSWQPFDGEHHFIFLSSVTLSHYINLHVKRYLNFSSQKKLKKIWLLSSGYFLCLIWYIFLICSYNNGNCIMIKLTRKYQCSLSIGTVIN